MELTAVTTTDLERLLAALSSGRLTFPLARFGLQSEGLEAFVPLVAQLNELGAAGTRASLAAVIAERRQGARPAELVWTGPESKRSGARDTAVVLDDLFARAQSSVLIAGFAFDHAADLLKPLHSALGRGVSCRVFADGTVAAAFIREHWPFGPPFPEVYGFVPAEGVFASLHAKCVVVDGRWVFVTSANFTDRGQTRNIEVGVLLDDQRLAATLEAQFATASWFERNG